jgi:hypothetical protein
MWLGAISIASNVLAIIGYFPEIYSSIYDIEVKNTTTIWVIWGLSGILGTTYGVCIENPYVIMSSCIGTGLNVLLIIIKRCKSKSRHLEQNDDTSASESESEISEKHHV